MRTLFVERRHRQNHMPKGWRVLIRVGIWTLGVFIALFPSLHAAHVRPSFNFDEMASAVNKAGFFRDFFFIVVVVSIASFANLLDNIVKNFGDAASWAKGV